MILKIDTSPNKRKMMQTTNHSNKPVTSILRDTTKTLLTQTKRESDMKLNSKVIFTQEEPSWPELSTENKLKSMDTKRNLMNLMPKEQKKQKNLKKLSEIIMKPSLFLPKLETSSKITLKPFHSSKRTKRSSHTLLNQKVYPWSKSKSRKEPEDSLREPWRDTFLLSNYSLKSQAKPKLLLRMDTSKRLLLYSTTLLLKSKNH
jgi:hypothetical protein